MDVLFVNNFRGRGGGEEFLRDLLPGLARKGVNVGLVCRPGTPLARMFEGSAVNVYTVDRSGSGVVSSVLRIAKIIRSGGYGIIDIQRGHDIIQSWAAAIISGRRQVLIYTPQVPEFIRSRFLLGRMDAVVTISRHIRDKISAYCPKIAGRTRIIHYGIDHAVFQYEKQKKGFLRKRFGLPPDAPIIGTVGDLWKNQIEFLDSLREIRKSAPEAMFAIAASVKDDGQTSRFKERASELGLSDAVIGAGRLDKDEMRSFYADIDIAVSTHRNEGFGIWILEALAAGRPVVAFDEGGVRDSLEGCPAGTLVKGGAGEMAEAVIRILMDDALRARMSGAGPRWVAERFARERMVEDYYRFFQSL